MSQPAPSSRLPSDSTPSRAEHDFLASYSLDTLISGAARLRPQALALCDRAHAVPFDLLAGQATGLARLMLDCGLKPGDRLLLTGGAETTLVIAIIAALRAGIEPALAPLDLDPAELADYARAVNAVALAGPSVYGAPLPAETYLGAAAAAPSIRLVATLGPDEIDGTADFSTAAVLRYAASGSHMGFEKSHGFGAPRVITYDRHLKAPIIHHQATLMAAALDFISRASIGRETPILSTLPPTNFAGLVTGPLAALLSGTTLYLEGPFDAAHFLKRLDSLDHAHLIIPTATATEFARADCFKTLASAVLVTRISATAPPQIARANIDSARPIFDLYAVDEMAAIAEPRRAGMPAPPAHQPHYIGFDDARILTVESAPEAGRPLNFRGAAVTQIA